MSDYSAYDHNSSNNVVRFAAALSVAVLIAQATIACPSHFVRLNVTASMPIGVYRQTGRAITRGAIVGACVPPPYAGLAYARGYLHSGICPLGVRPVMKYVAAVPGDSVEIRWSGVSVNGRRIANTGILPADSLGRVIPSLVGSYVVGPDQYWLISNRSPGSFDSRYFGPVTEILGVVEPILTDEQLCRWSPFKNLLRCGGAK